ncbi:C39 family peptidase [Micromonospora aurantiaca]|uniref:C39 family peptidase n=1 Tax=Micromonospora aurantiaca (nom. illeg.) TaxID=47850 RepID=A0ABQ6UAN7_9ACTN|nr:MULTISPECIES: C39 family peptidase [Micromonospora]KAB1106831.1 C39 family peptidase [Micromonospora aurantiaca]MBC8992059.1 C39 family peptidase [Micromonospora chalcea]MCT2279908.1 C39 family peptidase [Micromonospora chalcea]MDG4752734.1 C39 family peptidase [Micromonospora sp. WMMD718]OHX06977.1 phytochelatin synthase [Micromonospora sp. WMMB235]
MTTVTRWLPAITQTSVVRKAALGVAGLAFAGGAIAGPATVAHAAPVSAGKPATVAQERDGGKELDFTYKFQETYFYCAPAATKMALSALGKDLSQDELAKKLATTEAGTNSAIETTRVLKEVTGKDYRTVEIPGQKASKAETDRLRNDVVRNIDGKRPMVANIKGTSVDTDGHAHSYEGGHYIAVVGYRDGGNTVKIGDSWSDEGQYWISTDKLANWIASRGYSA